METLNGFAKRWIHTVKTLKILWITILIRWSKGLTLLIFLVMYLLVIPLVIILCSYGYIFIVSCKQRKNIRGQNNIPGMATAIEHEMKCASTLAIVVAVCLLSIVPLIIVAGLRFFGEPLECSHSNMKFVVFDFATVSNATLCAVGSWYKRAWCSKWRICHQKKITWRGSNVFQTLGANSGYRDFGNKNGKKKNFLSAFIISIRNLHLSKSD